ncbi:MAG: sigma-70 family RNA polymerase sigma factor [Planctomycetes bacterium]|nr:sigma-70 family RNA polymerase sigma factor [Planctomycetota bacterium]
MVTTNPRIVHKRSHLMTGPQLDERLAVGPDSFEEQVELLLTEFDKNDVRLVRLSDLDVNGRPLVHTNRIAAHAGEMEEDTESDLDVPDPPVPASESATRARVRSERSQTLLATYRSQIATIPMMTREDEVRMAKRVEFLRLRLERELSLRKVSRDVVEHATCSRCTISGQPREGKCFEGVTATSEDVQRLHRMCCELNAVRNEMIERSLHLVLRLIDRYRGLGVSTLDLVQEGNASLFKAVEGFDWRRGVRFRTYATYWINQAFLNLIYNSSRTVRVPAYIQKAMKKINDARVRVGEFDPKVDDLAREANLPADLVKSAMEGNRYSLSLDRELEGQEGRRVMDLIEDPHAAIDVEALEDITLPRQLDRAMESLSDRERQVLRMRYGLSEVRAHTLAEVGDVLGVSLERVRQIQEAALAKLRGPRGRKLLTHFTTP